MWNAEGGMLSWENPPSLKLRRGRRRSPNIEGSILNGELGAGGEDR